jgi:hypothetical protein
MEWNLHETTSRWKTYRKQLFFEDLEVRDARPLLWLPFICIGCRILLWLIFKNSTVYTNNFQTVQGFSKDFWSNYCQNCYIGTLYCEWEDINFPSKSWEILWNLQDEQLGPPLWIPILHVLIGHCLLVLQEGCPTQKFGL